MGEDDDGCDERPTLPLSSSHLCLLGQLQRGQTVSFWFVFYIISRQRRMQHRGAISGLGWVGIGLDMSGWGNV